MRVLAELAEWDNGLLHLYHGTLSEYVESLLAGIDLDVCRARTDFGAGFYTTTSYEQAAEWARRKARTETRAPAVVRFSVDRNLLAKLESLVFVRWRPDANDYWRLVVHCRAGGVHRPGDASRPMYDLVAGPVALRFDDGERLASDRYDQVSAHTPRAVGLLDAAEKGRVL